MTRRPLWPARTTQGAESNDTKPPSGKHAQQNREALGRSRGGLSTKLHLLADQRHRPLARVTTAGQRHDSKAFQPLMDQLRIQRHGRGRPRTRPNRLLGDKAYSNRAIREHLRRRRITTVIPEPVDQIRHRRARGSKGGRPPKFDPEAYKQRNTVERAFNRLKACRGVAMRTDKRDYVYRGTIDVASIKLWLRDTIPDDP
jgi:transposase